MARSTWTWTWTGCPSRPGSIRAAISRWHASSSASWRRCSSVRVSSGPALPDRASSTTVRAAAPAGVRSPASRPAPPMVVSSHRPGHRTRRRRGRARGGPVRPSPAPTHRGRADPRPPAPPPAGSDPHPPGGLRGSRPVQSQICRAHDALTCPAASAPASTGCAASRRAHPVAPAAAPRVTLVTARSHDFAPNCPSAWNPCCAVNADKIFARAAVWRASACSSPISAAACAAVPRPAASQPARYPSPACTMASACAGPDGAAGSLRVHMDGITSPDRGMSKRGTITPGPASQDRKLPGLTPAPSAEGGRRSRTHRRLSPPVTRRSTRRSLSRPAG